MTLRLNCRFIADLLKRSFERRPTTFGATEVCDPAEEPLFAVPSSAQHVDDEPERLVRSMSASASPMRQRLLSETALGKHLPREILAAVSKEIQQRFAADVGRSR